jgi:hypothetical protein
VKKVFVGDMSPQMPQRSFQPPPAPRVYERCPLTYLRNMYKAAQRSGTPPKRPAVAAQVPIKVVYGFDLKK